MLKLRLQRVIDGARKSPPSWGDGQPIVNWPRTESCSRVYCSGSSRTVRSTQGAYKIERIGFRRSAGLGLLADVVRIIDRQMRALAANIADLRSRIVANLFLHSKVEELHVSRILGAWRP